MKYFQFKFKRINLRDQAPQIKIDFTNSVWKIQLKSGPVEMGNPIGEVALWYDLGQMAQRKTVFPLA